MSRDWSRTSRRSAPSGGSTGSRSTNLCYGVKVAPGTRLNYLCHVERLVLDSVLEPMDLILFYGETLPAVPRALCACAVPRLVFTARPVADLSGWWRRHAALTAAAARTAGRRPGRRELAPLGRNDLLGMLVAGDFDPALEPGLPGRGTGCAGRRSGTSAAPQPADLAVAGRPPPPRDHQPALYAATTCQETRFPGPATRRPTPPSPPRRPAAR